MGVTFLTINAKGLNHPAKDKTLERSFIVHIQHHLCAGDALLQKSFSKIHP